LILAAGELDLLRLVFRLAAAGFADLLGVGAGLRDGAFARHRRKRKESAGPDDHANQ
jgi:hypothetical protein